MSSIRRPQAFLLSPLAFLLCVVPLFGGLNDSWYVSHWTHSTGGAGEADGRGSAAAFAYPAGIAAAPDGSLIIADTLNHTIRRLTTDGTVVTIAGLAGAGGHLDAVGNGARFLYPESVAVDSIGTIYVADRSNTIRRISRGVVSTIAGRPGVWGSHDGPALDATFGMSNAIAVAPDGSLVISDGYNYTIRRLSVDGTVTTIAGKAGESGASDGKGAEARFGFTCQLTVDRQGVVWLVDTNNRTVRKISPDGIVATVSGRAGESAIVDGPATTARFESPQGIALSSNGDVFVSETNAGVVRRIDRYGFVSTFATGLRTPSGIAAAADGNLYVADTWSHTISKISPLGSTATIAGSPSHVDTNDGPRTTSGVIEPVAIAFRTDGTAWVVSDNAIRTISPSGYISTIAGQPGRRGAADGNGRDAMFNIPSSIAFDLQGNAIIADMFSHTIRRITPSGYVTTIAGLAFNSGLTDGYASQARFSYPSGVAVAPDGTIYVADSYNHSIRKISTSGVVSTVAGRGRCEFADGVGTAAAFCLPTDLIVSPSGIVYVADNQNNRIRAIDQNGTVTTLAGSGMGFADGRGTGAGFDYPGGIVLNKDGVLFIADSGNDAVRAITPDGTVTTIAGHPRHTGSSDGPGFRAHFNWISGITLDKDGNLYVTDVHNNAVRKLQPCSALPEKCSARNHGARR